MHSKSSFKKEIKKAINSIGRTYRKSTSYGRMLPSFLIIGTQKGGTSSLYNYIIQHPYVLNSKIKEIHYFDNNFSKGINWYRSFFQSYKNRRDSSPIVQPTKTGKYLIKS